MYISIYIYIYTGRVVETAYPETTSKRTVEVYGMPIVWKISKIAI